MLFSWMPVPGTITPEPEPVDEESDAALPVGVDGGDVRRAACRRVLGAPGSDASIRATAAASDSSDEQPLREPAAMEAAREAAVAHARLLAHHLDERRDRLGAARPRRAPTRSSSASPYAIRMPPDDGGGFETTSCPR